MYKLKKHYSANHQVQSTKTFDIFYKFSVFIKMTLRKILLQVLASKGLSGRISITDKIIVNSKE